MVHHSQADLGYEFSPVKPAPVNSIYNLIDTLKVLKYQYYFYWKIYMDSKYEVDENMIDENNKKESKELFKFK